MLGKNQYPNTFIVLEGLSGSGKTTIGKLLSEKIRAHFYETRSTLFAPFRSVVDQNANPNASLLFYLASIFQSSAEIAQILKTKSVVCDRYMLTTIYYHQVLGTTIEIPDSFLEKLLNPDYVFWVVREEEKRIRYLAISHSDYDSPERKRREQMLLTGYKKHNLLQIDNSSDNPTEAVEKIISLMRS